MKTRFEPSMLRALAREARRRRALLAAVPAALLAATALAFGAQEEPSRDEIFELKEREVEALGKVADFERMLDRHGYVVADEALADYVTSVGRRLLPEDSRDDRIKFNFKLMRSPEPNAFALPNGSIYVTIGLLSLMENEGQLAAVLAHEVNHASRYHYFRFDRQYKAKSVTLNLFSAGMVVVPGWGGLLAQLGAEALYVGTIFGYSRNLEEEADLTGLIALESAGYDPAQMPESFRRLLVDDEGTNVDSPLFYSSHPRLHDRIASTEALIREKGLTVDAAKAFPEPYAAPREAASRQEVRLAIRNSLPRTALATAERMVALRPDSAEAYHLRAEAYRALGFRVKDISADPPGDEEKKRKRRERRRKTPEEIERELAGTEEGRAAWNENAAAAEAGYRKALELDPGYFDAQMGLALLYDEQGRQTDALAAAEAYLQWAPDGNLERARALRLRDELTRKLDEVASTAGR